MKLLGKGVLDDFVTAHADAKSWIENWVSDVEFATWAGPQDIKNRYASASFLKGNVVIFNVRGNNYRLEVKVAFNAGSVLVTWAGTHAEYTKRYK